MPDKAKIALTAALREWRRLSRYNPNADREDVIASTVLSVWHALRDRYDPERGVKMQTFANRVAKWDMRDRIKKDKNWRKLNCVGSLPEHWSDRQAVVDSAIESEMRERLYVILDSLTNRQREVLWHRAYGGVDADLAKKYGMSEGGVGQIRIRLLRRLSQTETA